MMGYSCEIKVTYDTPPMSGAPDLGILTSAIQDLYTVLPLVELKAKRDVVVLTKYKYEWKAADGRKWTQTIDFADSTTDPKMNFDVPDFFRLSEFEKHREVRAALVALIPKHTIIKFEVTFT